VSLQGLPPRSLILACDGGIADLQRVVGETCDLPQVGAYKIGARLALSDGLSAVVRRTRQLTTKPLIYDHQKAGTEAPHTAVGFMATLVDAGVDAVILFPFAGPQSQMTWTQAAIERGLTTLVGAHMSLPDFLSEDGGYVPRSSVERIYRSAAASGVRDFVVPGNDLDAIGRIRSIVDGAVDEATYYAPGFVLQGGSISEASRVAGGRWHAIVGRGVSERPDVRAAALALAEELGYRSST
jgi:orotidine-5'-phosphate decarboxylase